MLTKSKQYIVDAKENKLAVILDWQVYSAIESELDELYCMLGYKQAKPVVEKELEDGEYLTLDEFIENIEY